MTSMGAGLRRNSISSANDPVADAGLVEVHPEAQAAPLLVEEKRFGLHPGDQGLFVIPKAAQVQAI